MPLMRSLIPFLTKRKILCVMTLGGLIVSLVGTGVVGSVVRYGRDMLGYHQARWDLDDVHDSWRRARLPVYMNQIYSKGEDEVSPVLVELTGINDHQRFREILKQGQPYPDEVTNSLWMLNSKFNSAKHQNLKRSYRCVSWGNVIPDVSEDAAAKINSFCSYPANQLALSSVMRTSAHWFRDGSDDDPYFHGVAMEPGFSEARDILHYYFLEALNSEDTDEAKRVRLYDLLMVTLKMENLLVQGYSFDHYSDRFDHAKMAIKSWMAIDRIYGTPRQYIGEIEEWTSYHVEEKIWLKCHDIARIRGDLMIFNEERHEEITTIMSRQNYEGFVITPIFPLRHIKLRSDYARDVVLYGKQMMKIRGVGHEEYSMSQEFRTRSKAEPVSNTPVRVSSWIVNLIEMHHELLQWHSILVLGLKLNLFADQNGNLPNSLDLLSDSLSDLILKDHFPILKSESLIYKKRGDSFELRSVGINGVDDSGRGDDIVYTGRRARPPAK